jgi:hypothetical protein
MPPVLDGSISLARKLISDLLKDIKSHREAGRLALGATPSSAKDGPPNAPAP